MPAELPETVRDWLAESNHGGIVSEIQATGGCIHSGRSLRMDSGATFFLKTNPSVPKDVFPTEAEGLEAIAITGCIRTPAVYLVGRDFLLLEDLSPAPRASDYWPALGRGMACLHASTASTFGFHHDNYLGSTPQPNAPSQNGYAFFAEKRLNYQAEMAAGRGLLSGAEAGQITRLAGRLPDYIPEQPASLIHGDLWSGNLLTDAAGNPALIDPAAHYGWAEADLAMMVLFGSPPERFFNTYQEANPRPPGLHNRFPLYNLYHLLNHLNIFGSSYHGQVMGVVRRYQ
jgi:fructosamine-3-kinase